MTDEDILRMASEAGFSVHEGMAWGGASDLRRFADAELKERLRYDIHSCGPTCKRFFCVAVRNAVASEREACAKIALNTPHIDEYNTPTVAIYRAIRSRGNT